MSTPQSTALRLTKAPPANRTAEQLANHYQVEKALAHSLMSSTREERKAIYATMYDELFAKVPDHPRLTRRADESRTAEVNRLKLKLIEPFIDRTTTFLEYAPGDCRFAIDVAEYVKFAYGLDISDQRREGEHIPDNFRLVVYDGYDLDSIPDGSIDVIFSDQLIEHFHPEDTRHHFEVAYRLLRKGGIYLFRTPHSLTGPHDISQYFSDEPEGFHLKEWKHGEIRELLTGVGYSSAHALWNRRDIAVRLPFAYFIGAEKLLQLFPKRRVKRLAGVLLTSLCVIAVK